MSSPPTPKNPPKPHQPNNIIHLKSWHSSYAPLATIKVWINSIEGQLRSCGNKLPPPTCTALSQSNKPHRINLLPATPIRVVILAKPQESSFWRSQNLRIGFCCAAALSGGQNKPHRINILSATRSGSIFCRHHQRQSLFFTHNPYFLSILAATSTQ